MAMASLLLCACPALAMGRDDPIQEKAPVRMQVVVVEEGDGGRYWKADEQAGVVHAPAYPPALMRAGIDGCVNIGFVIAPDGKPGEFRILRFDASRPSREVGQALASSAVRAIRERRYAPGPDNPARTPGFASVTTGFATDAGNGSEQWKARCAIADPGAFVQAQDAKRDGGK